MKTEFEQIGSSKNISFFLQQ